MKFAGLCILSSLAVFAICVPAQSRPDEKRPPAANTPPPPSGEQVIAAAPCPKVEIRTAQRPVRDGEQVAFTVNLTGGDTKIAPTFYWSISAGAVSGGQGTRNIGVDTTGAGTDKAITANVLVGGFPPECVVDASATIDVAAPAAKLDEYESLAETEENDRLNAFMAAITEKEQAYIFVYAGRTSPRGYASTDLRRIRAYLLKAGMPPSRLVTIDGGFREGAVHELWIVPVGAEAPRSTPTLHARDIVYPKTAPAVKKP